MPTRILVVDDDPTLVSALTDALAGAGYATTRAGDGVEALAAIERAMPDLLLTDLLMPRLSGLELVHRVRTLSEQGRYLPVILITAAPPVSGLPPRTYLIPKPFDLPAVLTLVARLVGKLGG